jgi:uncharacterized protein YbaR (Trm112 family)
MATNTNSNSPDTKEAEIPLWLLPLIRCPITKQGLQLAPRSTMDSLRELAAQGLLRSKNGISVSEIPSQGLLNVDQSWLYPIRRGIPSLIPGDAISLNQEVHPKN